MQRRIQVAGWALIWGGVFIFGYLGYQLFITDLINQGVQEQAAEDLSQSFADIDDQPAEQIDPDVFVGSDEQVPENTPDVVSYFPEAKPPTGAALAFLRIPTIGVEEVLFEGVDSETLKSGPGHMERTPLPGQPGNSVLSGHRTTDGSPFFDFDLLEIHDQIEVETAIGTHTYVIREIRIVEPTDVWVTNERPGGWLTLTTCNPKFSARERLVVWAEMVSGPNFQYVQLHEAAAAGPNA